MENNLSWKTVFHHSITNMTKSKSDHITLTDGEGNDVHDPDKIANMFCDYFSSVATELDRNSLLTLSPCSFKKKNHRLYIANSQFFIQ